MREAVERVGRQLDQLQQLADALGSRRFASSEVGHALADDRADLQPRVERVVRVLEDDLGLLPEAAQLLRRACSTSCPSKLDAARRRLDQAQDRRARVICRSRSRRPGPASRRADIERDVVDGLEPSSSGARRSRGRPGSASSAPHREQRLSGVRRRAWGCSSGAHGSRRVRSSVGCFSTHGAMRFGQRGAKRQAGGMACSSGTRPGITGGARPRGQVRHAASRPWV